MSQLEDKLNSLSDDELNQLNSDPQMLSEFKAKYSVPPPSVTPDLIAKTAGAAMDFIPSPLNAIKDLGNNISGVASGLKAGLYDIPKAIGMLPAELAQGKGPEQTSLGQFTEQGTQGMAQGIKNAVENPLDTVSKNPFSTATLFMGLPESQELSGIEGATKGFADTLAENSGSKLAKINNKLAKVSENATKMGGQNLPIPTEQELSKATQAVIDAKQGMIVENGKAINDAKENLGLPVSVDDKQASLRKYGNAHNLDISKPLALPDNLTQNAPKMEGLEPKPELRTIDPKDVPTDKPYALYIGSTKPNAEYNFPGLDYYDIHGSGGPISDTNKMPTFTISNENDLKRFSDQGISILGKKDRAGSQVPLYDYGDYTQQAGPKPMPYKITPSNNAQDLGTEIGRFLQNQDYISNTDKVKAAGYFQDKINNYVDWTKPGTDQEAVLKGQYSSLKDVIANNSPELQDAKNKWADMKNNLDLVDKGIDPSQPGKTQSYLRNLFLSDDPKAQDKLKQLAYMESATGKPVITNLFKQFAGQAFEPWMSRHAQIYEAAGAGAGLAYGHPAAAVTAALAAGIQSPKVLGALESGISKVPSALSRFGPSAGFQMMNTPDMQSLRDRLRNNQ